MNHSFMKGTTPNQCAQCKRSALDHTDIAQCESCARSGPCELIDDILMCAQCQARDKEIAAELEAVKYPSASVQRLTELVNALGKEIPQESRQYFVNEVTQIVDIEQKIKDTGIDNPQYECAQVIESRIQSFKQNLFEVKKLELELKVNMISDQKYLNNLVPKLREEEREKFKAYDISYKPSVVATSVSAPKQRQSASDKAIESFAKMMSITVEQARRQLESATKNVTGAQCTCADTPGVCKVHPKG